MTGSAGAHGGGEIQRRLDPHEGAIPGQDKFNAFWTTRPGQCSPLLLWLKNQGHFSNRLFSTLKSTQPLISRSEYVNTNPEEYDLVCPRQPCRRKLIAWTSAQKGQRVVVIERKYVGGACPNIACLPSKTIIHSAKVASFFITRGVRISKKNVTSTWEPCASASARWSKTS